MLSYTDVDMAIRVPPMELPKLFTPYGRILLISLLTVRLQDTGPQLALTTV